VRRTQGITDMRGLLWWITSVMGDKDYERYVAHMQRVHPGEPVPSERQFWRDRYADADTNPGARCC
jgi:uncharacterized short protein YbdD (DUF466 family)